MISEQEVQFNIHPSYFLLLNLSSYNFFSAIFALHKLFSSLSLHLYSTFKFFFLGWGVILEQELH